MDLSEAARLKHLFKKYDTNGDGTISREEMETLMKFIRTDDPLDVDEVFKLVDANHNGVIGYDEFVDWLMQDDDASQRLIEKDYAETKLEFTTKPGCDDYADCSGTYTLDPTAGNINGKPIYVNCVKGKFLAATSSDVGWCITGLVYLDQIKSQEGGGFGGFHAGGGDEPEDGEWANYIVHCCVSVRFVTKPGCDNYANCDGEYVLEHSQGKINSKPIYVNRVKDKFLAATSSEIGWCITSLAYLDEIKCQGSGGFGGFHAGGGDDPEEGDWSSYHVTCSGRRSGNPLKDIAQNSSSWQKFENTTVSIKAGGDALPEYGLYCGSVSAPEIPECLKMVDF